MGYRSDVVLAVKKEVYAKAFITDSLPSLCKEITPVKHELGVFWIFHNYKWYEGYKEIDAVNAFVDSLEEEQDERDVYGLCGFVRIGEEIGDIEIKGDPSYFDVYPEQTFSVPFDY